jgi:hypothetical protein
VTLGRAAYHRYQDDGVDTHATALAYQLFLSMLALSLAGLALIGLLQEALPFDLPEGTQEQFENLVQGDAVLGAASALLLWDRGRAGSSSHPRPGDRVPHRLVRRGWRRLRSWPRRSD